VRISARLDVVDSMASGRTCSRLTAANQTSVHGAVGVHSGRLLPVFLLVAAIWNGSVDAYAGIKSPQLKRRGQRVVYGAVGVGSRYRSRMAMVAAKSSHSASILVPLVA
jgi:hypothetical protein